MQTKKSHFKFIVGIMVIFVFSATPLIYFYIQNNRLIADLSKETPSDIYWQRLALTTHYMQSVKSGDIDKLKIILIKKLDDQLYDYIENNNIGGLDKGCFFRKLAIFRNQFDNNYLDAKVTESLREISKNKTCKYDL